ncbi:MAG: hypothetical protein HFE80_01105 [Clostridiaceae bacterium]|nr:hypothetical protein [Clostridiaceae bacterium]
MIPCAAFSALFFVLSFAMQAENRFPNSPSSESPDFYFSIDGAFKQKHFILIARSAILGKRGICFHVCKSDFLQYLFHFSKLIEMRLKIHFFRLHQCGALISLINGRRKLRLAALVIIIFFHSIASDFIYPLQSASVSRRRRALRRRPRRLFQAMGALKNSAV